MASVPLSLQSSCVCIIACSDIISAAYPAAWVIGSLKYVAKDRSRSAQEIGELGGNQERNTK